MKFRLVWRYGLLCLMLCLLPQMGLCEAALPSESVPSEKTVEGAYLTEKMLDEAMAEEWKRMLESIAYTSLSNGNTLIFPINDEGSALRCRTLNLDTLQLCDDVTLRTFDEGEALLRVLPRPGGFDALTNRALYRYDSEPRLIQTTPLPEALLGIEGVQEKLRLSGQVNQEGTLLLFEAEGQGGGIYLCGLEPEGEPSLLLAGTTLADAKGNALEGYREGRFEGQDRVSAYLWDQEGRIAYELFDLKGQCLYQSFVFHQRTTSEASGQESRGEKRPRESEDAGGVLLGSPTSLGTIWGAFYYFDSQAMQLDRITSWALDQARLQFCALDGKDCIFAVSDWRFDEKHRSDIQFFKEDLTTTETEELRLALRDVSEFTAALAPGGHILFVCRDYETGVFFRGGFRIP